MLPFIVYPNLVQLKIFNFNFKKIIDPLEYDLWSDINVQALMQTLHPSSCDFQLSANQVQRSPGIQTKARGQKNKAKNKFSSTASVRMKNR